MSENEQTNTGLENQNANTFDEANAADVNNANSETGNETPQTETNKENTQNADSSNVPENYDFKNLKMPDGFQFDEALAEKFAPVGKEIGLSQEQANKLANLFIEYQQAQLEDAPNKIAEFKRQEKEATKISYEKLLNDDKEISCNGDKAKMNAYLDVADIGYSNFATDELKGVFQELSLNYHPAVIKLFHRLGKLCGNDSISKTNSPVSAEKSAAEILYGGDN